MTIEEHRQRHVILHKAFDELLADWILHTGGLPSKLSALELGKWSFGQTKNPTAVSEAGTAALLPWAKR